MTDARVDADVPARHRAVPARAAPAARVRAALPADDRSACCAATASSASCSSSAAARSAAATSASASAPSRASCARRSFPTAATRSRRSAIRRIRVDALARPTIRTRRPRSSTSIRAPTAGADGNAGAPRDRARRRARRRVHAVPPADPRVPDLPGRRPTDPAQASYEIAALAPIGPLDAQRVLETVPRRRIASRCSPDLLDEHARVAARRRFAGLTRRVAGTLAA